MAKKAETAEPSTSVTTKADAVRAAVAANVLKPQEACAWIKDQFGIEITPAHFSSYKSQQAKQSGASGAGKRRGRRPTSPSAFGTPTSGRHVSPGGAADLAKQLKGLITQYGADEVSGMLGVLRD